MAQVDASRATRIAADDPNAVKEREEHTVLTHSANMVDGNWEVGYFAGDKEVALVIVDPLTGAVRESWTGYQVAWKMARGYSGAFGHKLNAPYVFLPLCALFLLGLVDWRRLWRVANLDLLVLLGFGVSNFFFNRARDRRLGAAAVHPASSTSSAGRCGSGCGAGGRASARAGPRPGC